MFLTRDNIVFDFFLFLKWNVKTEYARKALLLSSTACILVKMNIMSRVANQTCNDLFEGYTIHNHFFVPSQIVQIFSISLAPNYVQCDKSQNSRTFLLTYSTFDCYFAKHYAYFANYHPTTKSLLKTRSKRFRKLHDIVIERKVAKIRPVALNSKQYLLLSD